MYGVEEQVRERQEGTPLEATQHEPGELSRVLGLPEAMEAVIGEVRHVDCHREHEGDREQRPRQPAHSPQDVDQGYRYQEQQWQEAQAGGSRESEQESVQEDPVTSDDQGVE